MTRSRPLAEMRRPGRRLSALLRDLLNCPLCRGGDLASVKLRRSSFRLKCRRCGLVFSVSPENVAEAVKNAPVEAEVISHVVEVCARVARAPARGATRAS